MESGQSNDQALVHQPWQWGITASMIFTYLHKWSVFQLPVRLTPVPHQNGAATIQSTFVRALQSVFYQIMRMIFQEPFAIIVLSLESQPGWCNTLGKNMKRRLKTSKINWCMPPKCKQLRANGTSLAAASWSWFLTSRMGNKLTHQPVPRLHPCFLALFLVSLQGSPPRR